MARITGELRDFGFVHWPTRQPKMYLIPSGVGTALGWMLSEQRVKIAVDGSNSAFDFFVVGSDVVQPQRRYSIMVRWLDSAGNFTTEDWWHDLWIPDDWDGPIGALLAQAGTPSPMRVIYQAEEPDERLVPPGAVWVNTETWDVKRRPM